MSNYCPYPFLAVCLSPGDYVVPCCHMDWTDLTDDWQTKNIDTTFSEYDPIKKSLLKKNTVLLDNYYNKSYKDYLHPYIVDYIEGENFGS